MEDWFFVFPLVKRGEAFALSFFFSDFLLMMSAVLEEGVMTNSGLLNSGDALS